MQRLERLADRTWRLTVQVCALKMGELANWEKRATQADSEEMWEDPAVKWVMVEKGINADELKQARQEDFQNLVDFD
eukprot:12307800-Alexandrium_andersonii.AAC.1